MTILKAIISVLIILSSGPLAVFAQNDPIKQYEKTRKDTDSLLLKINRFINDRNLDNDKTVLLKNNYSDVKRLMNVYLDDMKAELSVNNDHLNEQKAAEFSQYVKEANNSLQLLNRSYISKDVEALDTAISYVILDYKHKISASSGLGWDNPTRVSRPPVRIKVTVRVMGRSDGKELHGYNVFCKPVHSVSPNLIDFFNPTTNAVKQVVPGEKLIWIERGGKKVDERVVSLIWSEPTETVDFFVE